MHLIDKPLLDISKYSTLKGDNDLVKVVSRFYLRMVFPEFNGNYRIVFQALSQSRIKCIFNMIDLKILTFLYYCYYVEPAFLIDRISLQIAVSSIDY